MKTNKPFAHNKLGQFKDILRCSQCDEKYEKLGRGRLIITSLISCLNLLIDR